MKMVSSSKNAAKIAESSMLVVSSCILVITTFSRTKNEKKDKQHHQNKKQKTKTVVNDCDADRKWEEKNNQQNVQMYIAQSQRLYILVMLCIQTMHNNPFNVYACILIIVIVLKTFGVFQKKSQQMKHETRRKKKRTPTAYVYYIKSVAFYVQKEILYM